ncbi:PadR family transcriptional regulator [Nocardioides caldifontis]|uniref:PadR family transcriptional regulator n=1 Tax=Nocardioides caldifontis TaxID=2588938 RepID=UPI0011DF74A0|nr:PadR family transcriptional regulator [Nocardioides caldifontis]
MTRRGETLELAVLGLLHENPMHGYELRKQLNLVLGRGRVLSYGSLYPALKKMLRAGFITEHVAAAPVPAKRATRARSGAAKTTTTGAVSRRQRIVYELTPAGDERFAKLMSEAGPAAWEDDDFGVRFAFFGRTDREIRLRILEGRRARLEERLAHVRRDLLASEGAPTTNSYAVELARHGLESVEREVSWLSDLIAAERGEGRHEGQDGPTVTGRLGKPETT